MNSVDNYSAAIFHIILLPFLNKAKNTSIIIMHSCPTLLQKGYGFQTIELVQLQDDNRDAGMHYKFTIRPQKKKKKTLFYKPAPTNPIF